MTLEPRRLVLALALLGACGAPPISTPAPSEIVEAPAAAVVEGPIAATVDGDPISVAEVEQTARDTGLSPLEALHRLEQERALLRRAAHARLDVDERAESAMRRASVQALLRARIEDTVGDADVADTEIAARYQASRASWARPERRASEHVLATPREASDEAARAAAERFVRAAIVRLAAAADPSAEAAAIEAEGAEGRSFTVTVETVPAVDRHGPLEAPYLAALFAIPSAPGVAPEPVTTRFGLHAIVLTSIEPPFEVSLAEATPVLRRQLVAEHRAAALDALTAELASHTTVAIDERTAAVVFAADLSEPGAHAP